MTRLLLNSIMGVYVVRPTCDVQGITVERCIAGDVQHPDTWKVVRGGFTFDKSGCWEFEPSPSNRTDDYLSENRYATFREVMVAARRAVKA